jgi:hypothetical protein
MARKLKLTREQVIERGIALVKENPFLAEWLITIAELDLPELEALDGIYTWLVDRCRAELRERKWRADQRRRAGATREPFAPGLGKLAAEIGADVAAARYGVILSTAQLARQQHNMRERDAQRRWRDIQVMRLYVKGWSDARIAKKMKLAPRTVSRIVHDALRDNPLPAELADAEGDAGRRASKPIAAEPQAETLSALANPSALPLREARLKRPAALANPAAVPARSAP